MKGQDFGSGHSGGQSSLLCACFNCIACGFGLLFLKSNAVSCELVLQLQPLFIIIEQALHFVGEVKSHIKQQRN